MATSVHLPKALLSAVDKKARALKISRNALIVKALEREINEGREWPAGFLEKVGVVGADLEDAVDDMVRTIRAARRSKKRPPRL
jgi:hypothetical protein